MLLMLARWLTYVNLTGYFRNRKKYSRYHKTTNAQKDLMEVPYISPYGLEETLNQSNVRVNILDFRTEDCLCGVSSGVVP